MGLDLYKGTIRNNLEAGVIEPAMSKVKILQVSKTFQADDAIDHQGLMGFCLQTNLSM